LEQFFIEGFFQKETIVTIQLTNNLELCLFMNIYYDLIFFRMLFFK